MLACVFRFYAHCPSSLYRATLRTDLALMKGFINYQYAFCCSIPGTARPRCPSLMPKWLPCSGSDHTVEALIKGNLFNVWGVSRYGVIMVVRLTNIRASLTYTTYIPAKIAISLSPKTLTNKNCKTSINNILEFSLQPMFGKRANLFCTAHIISMLGSPRH